MCTMEGSSRKRGHGHCSVTVCRQHSYAVVQSCRDRRLRQTARVMEGSHQQHGAIPQAVGWPHLLVADGRDGGDVHHVVGGRGLRVLVVECGPVPAVCRCKPLGLQRNTQCDAQCYGRSSEHCGRDQRTVRQEPAAHTHDLQLTCTSLPRSQSGGCTCCPSECATGCGSIRCSCCRGRCCHIRLPVRICCCRSCVTVPNMVASRTRARVGVVYVVEDVPRCGGEQVLDF